MIRLLHIYIYERTREEEEEEVAEKKKKKKLRRRRGGEELNSGGEKRAEVGGKSFGQVELLLLALVVWL